jgi:hypothetical protein
MPRAAVKTEMERAILEGILRKLDGRKILV